MKSTKPTIIVAVGEPQAGERLARELGDGYTVLLARDGVDAAVQYERRAAEVSAVVADMRLSRLSGDLLAEWLHHIDPQLPVIITAGSGAGAVSRGITINVGSGSCQ